ncbi:MAG: holo-ACP synthase [Clostridia bacterium]|nr:holo-ACP synthase [Clostridia bacterium]
MILGLGTDLCAIERIGRAIEKRHFMERVYTPAELARLDAATDLRRPEIAAGLFAAKEAVAKALGTGFSGFFTSDIEIMPDAAGHPVCALLNGAKARAEALAGGESYAMWVSITHESGMAAATAILEKREARDE